MQIFSKTHFQIHSVFHCDVSGLLFSSLCHLCGCVSLQTALSPCLEQVEETKTWPAESS